MEMTKEEAKEYLEMKGELYKPVKARTQEECDKLNEKEINKVMKMGKIYGDPVVEVDW